MKILYIGNKLSSSSKTPTGVETLGIHLQEWAQVITTSDKLNCIARMMDMVCTLYRNRRTVDVVLMDTYSTANFFYTWLASLLCRQFHLKYIPILRGGNLPYRLDRTPKLCRQLFMHSYVNVAPSAYLKEAFKQKGFNNVILIPNFLDINEYVMKEHHLFCPPHLLWVRSFDKTYHPTMAVEVLAQLKKAYPQATLIMVGPDKDGSMEATKAKAQALGLQIPEDVQFTGKLPRSQWCQIAQEHNIFINTTNIDNTPVSVMEAILLGLPVVSTNVGGIPYLLKDGEDSWLVPKDDVVSMVRCIEQIVTNPTEAKRRIGQAYRKVAAFDWSIVKQQWHELLTQTD